MVLNPADASTIGEVKPTFLIISKRVEVRDFLTVITTKYSFNLEA